MRRREFIVGLGGVAAAPFVAHSQQRTPVIGFLHSGTSEQDANRLAGFLSGLAESGFVEGKNLTIEYRWANGQSERLPALASDLRKPSPCHDVSHVPPVSNA